RLAADSAAPLGADAWPGIARLRSVEIGSAEDMAGRGLWREMLSRVERAQLPHSSTLAHVRRPLSDANRQVGIISLGQEGAAFAAVENEEAVVAASFATALSEVSGCQDLVFERWTSARKDAPLAVGPLDRKMPMAIDSIRTSRVGAVEAAAQMMRQGSAHPAFDTDAIAEALGEEMPDAMALLHQYGMAYIDADGDALSAGLLGDLVGQQRLDMPYDLCLHAVRQAGKLKLELAFDCSRVTRADARAVGDALIGALKTLSGQPRSKAFADAGAWRRSGAAENTRARQIENLAERRKISAKPLAAPAGIVAAADGSLPLTMQQNFLLDAWRHPDVTEDFKKFWWVSRTFKVRPSIDLNRLKAAAALVARRHDSARTRFIDSDAGTRVLIEQTYEPHVEMRDFGRVDEAEIVRMIEELDQQVPDPFNDPLWSITVMRCDGDGDVIYVRAHHSVFDGWSTALFIEEMLRAYIGQDLPQPELGLLGYLNRYDRSHEPEVMAEREAYFRELLRDPPALPNLNDGVADTRPNLEFVHAGLAQELVVTLADSQKLEIVERARMSGASPSALLIGAMAQSIDALAGTKDDVLICVPMAMRQDLALRHYLGWVATIAPVRCEVSRHRSLDTLAKQIYDQYQTSMAYLPADFALRRGELHRELGSEGSYLTLFEAGMLTADASGGKSSMRDLTRLGADSSVSLAGHEIQPVGNGRVRAGCAYHVDIRSFEGAAGHSYRCCYDSDVVSPDTAHHLFREVLGRLGVPDSSLGTIRENGTLAMDPAAE
ncbi:MAG: hypothetical protein HKN60_07850, partial [Rhizobiales bacterium]|nr:hypothetical protein [Hyphomicrobiales bacterium]